MVIWGKTWYGSLKAIITEQENMAAPSRVRLGSVKPLKARPSSPRDVAWLLGHSNWRLHSLYLWLLQNYKELELLRQVYYGGVEHEIRKDVWPFLLGHYRFGMSKKEMEQVREPAPTEPKN